MQALLERQDAHGSNRRCSGLMQVSQAGETAQSERQEARNGTGRGKVLVSTRFAPLKRAEQGGKRDRNGRKCRRAKVCADDRCDTSKQPGERECPKASGS